MTRWFALLLIAGVCLFTASALNRTAFTMYDEGVYFYEAVLFARGQTPYADFFAPQPPGLLVIGAASERLGTGIVGVRVVSWACGLVLLLQTYLIAGRISAQATGAWVEESGAREGTVPTDCNLATVALVAVTVVFSFQSIHGGTNTPAACLETAACVLLLGNGRWRLELAGLALAAATGFRVQSVVAAPGLVLLILFAGGRAGFLRRGLRFGSWLTLGGALIHLTLAATVTNYVNNVVTFHLDRTPTDWADRGWQVLEFLAEGPVVVGLLAAGWLIVCGPKKARGLAAHGLITSVVVALAGKNLSVMYFLPVLPVLAGCAACAVERVCANRLWVPAVGLLVVAAVRGPVVVETVLAQVRPDAEHAACVEAVRSAPGNRVLTSDGRIAVLAGKTLPPHYYATDPNALALLDPVRFHEWFDRMLAAADMVVVTPQLLMWMSPGNAANLLASGKPVFFDTAASRQWFDELYRPGGGSR